MLESSYDNSFVEPGVVRHGDLLRKFSLRIPEKVSEFVTEDLEKSLNVFYPKMFFDIKIKRRSFEFIVPNDKKRISSIVRITELLTYDKKEVRVFKVELPVIKKKYMLHYHVKSDRVLKLWMQENEGE